MSKNKKVIIGILIAVLLIFIGVVVAYKLIENNIADREDFKFKIENISSNPVETENIDEKDISKILIEKTTYDYPYKMVIKVNKNGNVYKSKIVDELTEEGAPKDKFSRDGSVSKDDLIEIENIIDEMKKETRKNSNYSEDYGIAINIGESSLYGCEFFSQENVDKLNTIIQKYE